MSLSLRPTIDVTGSDNGRVLARPTNLRARVRMLAAASALLAQFFFSFTASADVSEGADLDQEAEWMNSVRVGLHSQVGEWTKLWEEQTWVAHLPPAEFEELSSLQQPTIQLGPRDLASRSHQIQTKRSHKSVSRLTKRTKAIRLALANAVTLVQDTAEEDVVATSQAEVTQEVATNPIRDYSNNEYSNQVWVQPDLVLAKADSTTLPKEKILWVTRSVLEMKMDAPLQAESVADTIKTEQSSVGRSPAIPSPERIRRIPNDTALPVNAPGIDSSEPQFSPEDSRVEDSEEVAYLEKAREHAHFDGNEPTADFDYSMTTQNVSAQSAAPGPIFTRPNSQPAAVTPTVETTPNVWVSSALVASLAPILPKTTQSLASVSDAGNWSMRETKPVPSNGVAKVSRITSGAVESAQPTKPTKMVAVEATETNSQVFVSKSALERRDARAATVEAEALPEKIEENASGEPPLFVEALQWKEAVYGAETETLSFESSERNFRANKTRSWARTSAHDHLDTISLSASPTLGRAIPLLSYNSLKALALLTNSGSATSTLGVIFGRKLKGMDLDTDGRAEQVLVFSDPENESFENFAILNVEPGARVVQASQAGSKKIFAGVAVPVLEGKATFVDMTQWRAQKVRGWVLDSDSADARGLAQVEVRLLAQAPVRAETDRWGRFMFEDVSVVADHPVFLETDTPKTVGFTHRYQVYAEHLGGTALYRFGQKRVDGWVHQLEGGVSQNSGIVVAGLAPVATLTQKSGAVFPQLRLVSGNPEPSAEVYTANDKGELIVHQPHNEGGAQVVALQVSEGLHRFELVNQSQSLIWSQWVMSSPGVINVITMSPER